jgi:hypothetical protein
LQDSIVLQSVFTNAREKLSKEWEETDDKDDEDAPEDMDEDEPITPASRYLSYQNLKTLFYTYL